MHWDGSPTEEWSNFALSLLLEKFRKEFPALHSVQSTSSTIPTNIIEEDGLPVTGLCLRVVVFHRADLAREDCLSDRGSAARPARPAAWVALACG